MLRTHVGAYLGVASGMPEDIDAVIATADLQFYEDRLDLPMEDRRLLGHVVAQELWALSALGLLPEASSTLVLLAGDLFAVPTLDRRGGLGDVEAIWRDFGDRFAHVVGVAGNHDSFRGHCAFGGTFDRQANVHPLHGDAVEIGGVKIAGLSGVMGGANKPWRNTPKATRQALSALLKGAPDVLLLHEGPAVPEVKGAGGNRELRKLLDALWHGPMLVVNGHLHWHTPLASATPNLQVLNVDARVLVLTREEIYAGVAGGLGVG